jgi:hypothetical protein
VPLDQVELFEPVDHPRRRRVVDPDAGGELADPQAGALADQRQRPQLARGELRPKLGVQGGVQASAGEDRPELAPAARELFGQRFQVTSRDICKIQKLLLAGVVSVGTFEEPDSEPGP